MSPSRSSFALLSLALAACTAAPAGTLDSGSPGVDSGTPGTDSGTPGTDAGPVETDAGAPVLETLISGAWSLPMGSERYICVRVTIDHDMYIHRFHPVIPTGTHHTVLTVGDSFVGGPMPDGITDCSSFVNGPNMLFGSGVGTGDLVLPPGIAVKVNAGDQLTLNLHLFNLTSPGTLSGISAIQVETMDPSLVTAQAETFLAGKTSGLTVAGHAISTQTGTCTVSAGHAFAVFPHMHQTGIHETVTLHHHATPDVVMLDTDYSFDMQEYHLLSPDVLFSDGDTLSIDCTYDNPGATKTWGEHTYDEMCFAGIYRWPAIGTILICNG